MANKFIDQNGLRYFFSKLKRMFEKKADKSDLKPVATSGKYSDLEGKPEIDTTVTEGSANAVSGGAVYTAINDLPSGNNALCVNITGTDTESLSADKTFSEISAAIDEGKVVVVNLEGNIFSFASRFDSLINFSSSAGTTFFVLSCTEDNVWIYGEFYWATTDDILDIAPIYVNITVNDDGQVVANKTYDEIKSLIQSNKEIIALYDGMKFYYSYSADDILLFSTGYANIHFNLACAANGWHFSRMELAASVQVEKLEPVYVTLSGNSNDGYTADKTFAELKTYYENGKKIIVRYNYTMFPLLGTGVDNKGEILMFYFSLTIEGSFFQIICSESGWMLGEDELITSSAITTEISESSSNGRIPSAKAVYDAIQNTAGSVHVTITEDGDGNLSADKTFDELVSSVESGARVTASYNNIEIPYVGASKMSSSASEGEITTETFSVLYFQCELSNQSYMLTCEESGWQKVYLNFLHEQVDQGQNDSTQLDYIKNRTHWKETSGNETIYHKLPNEYLNIDSAPTQDSKNLVSSGAVYEKLEAVKSAIPAVPSWALQETKPAYTADEVGADAAGKATSEVTAHNTNTEAHNDMRLLIKDLTDRLNALADSDDTTLDQMSEIVAYIKNNKSLIDNITTTKSNVADIINNLTTNVADKPLSAAQGVALKALIDAITVPTSLPANGGNSDTVDGKHATDFIQKSGGTMTGDLVLKGSPTSDNMAANKKYVDDSAHIISNKYNTGSETWYFPLGKMVVDDSGNFGNFTFTGRIGGWTKDNSATYSIMLMNRGSYDGNTITSTVSASGKANEALSICDIVVSKNSDLSHMVYLKCNGYFLYNFNWTQYQHSINYDGTHTTTEPSNIIWKLSTAPKTILTADGDFSATGGINASKIAGKTVVFSNTVPTVDDDNIITFVKRSG